MMSRPSASPACTVTGMNWLGEVVERGRDAGRREAGLGAGDVEADDATVAVAHGELGDLEPAVGVPHRGDELADADAAALVLHVVDALLDARLHGLDGLVEAEAAGEVLLGRPADLAVDDAVGARGPARTRARRGSRPSRVCMTAVVRSKVFRYSTSEPEFDCSANHVAERLGVGRRQPRGRSHRRAR